MQKNILLIDDDVDLRTTLAEQLLETGEFDIFEAGDAAEAIGKLKEQNFDLIVCDVGLPDADGREMVKVVRSRGINTPIIMLTAQATEEDTVRGLNSGANDYIAKPFKIAILIARIKAQLRQADLSEDANLIIGPYQFRPVEKTLELEDGSKTRLTEKETNILKFLYRADGKVVPRDTLLGEVWGYAEGVTTHTLETHIYRLRQKIETEKTGRIVVTADGGYKIGK